MFNFLVTAKADAWTNNFYEYDRSRFLEYTNEDIAFALKSLSPSNIESLKSYPCLFAYEDDESDMYIGHLTSIKVRGRSILIEFELLDEFNPIPYQTIQRIAPLLDIRGWELSRTHWAVKDEDLYSRLGTANIITPPIFPKENTLEKPVAEKTTTPTVTTVRGFIDKVLTLGPQVGYQTFYRGHSNKKKYKLEPSLFRKDGDGNYLYRDNEHILCRELLVSNSAEFQLDEYTLDRLVRMQHYSLPTRLLDITSNPLIALYFTCKSSLEEDGEVIVFSMNRENVKYFDSDVASCIANLARLPKTEKDQINFDLAKEQFNAQLPIKRLVHFIRQEKPFFEPGIIPDDLRKIICVKGKHSNSRISSQSGAFLLFGLDAVFDEDGTSEISVSRMTISKSSKKNILKELDLLNINESTVFPYIESSARYVADKFKFEKPISE